MNEQTIINEEKSRPNFSVSLGADGYFEDLLLKIQEQIKKGNRSRAVKLGIACAAKYLKVITDKEFDEVIRWRI